MTDDAPFLQLDGMDKIISCLGDACFRDELIAALNRITPVDHFSLVQLYGDQVRYITSASGPGKKVPESLQRLYLTHYYRFDPNQNYLRQLSSDNALIVNRLLSDDIEDESYQKLWCDQLGIVDRISLLTKADKGLYCFNLYRHSQPFSDDDIEVFKSLAPMLSAFAVKHTRLAGSLSDFQTREAQILELMHRISRLDSRLTQREQQVCARILLGMTSEGIGLDLEIKIASVQTYRKRAYSKLNISSQNELFALCLKAQPD